MTIRTMVMVAGLAALASGCTVTTHEYEGRRYHSSYVYHEDDSYEGYYYARIVYINGDPWYVDEYRRARPVPRHVYAHFRNSSWTRSLPPRFGSDDGVRDGYRVSRIVYINDVPHYVDDNRRARPVPSRMRDRFSYVTVVNGNDRDRRMGERPVPPAYGRDQDRPMPPSYGRDRDRPEPPVSVRERPEPPVYVRDRDRPEPPVFVRDRDRPEPPVYARDRDRPEPPVYARDRDRPEPPVYARERDRPEPPAYGRERGGEEAPPNRVDNLSRPAMMQERMREERGREPFARNGRVVDESSQGRGAGGGERRPMPQNNGRNAGDDAGGDRGLAASGVEKVRGRIQPVRDDGQYRRGVANDNESRADSVPERRNGKGRDRGRDDEASNGNGGRPYRGQ